MEVLCWSEKGFSKILTILQPKNEDQRMASTVKSEASNSKNRLDRWELGVSFSSANIKYMTIG